MESFCLHFKTILFISTIAIFGNKTHLRPGEDDEALLACLDVSDIEGFDEDNDDSENEEPETVGNFGNQGPIEANAEQQAEEQSSDESSSDSDPEFDIPISELKNRYGRKTWKKTERYVKNFQLHSARKVFGYYQFVI